jgi:hypothetical protein
MPLALR